MSVPEVLRPVVREQLDRLVAGDLPELLTWLREYGRNGATLAPQPDAIWSHPYANAVQTNGGGWHAVVPLWTTDESPSDLSAEMLVAPDGTAVLHDVHVLQRSPGARGKCRFRRSPRATRAALASRRAQGAPVALRRT